MTGIIPEFLTKRERPRRLSQELIVTRDMHERKRTMFERADAFVALPGGIGTLEELVEQLTWVQLGRHKKPILIANIAGYWGPLLALIDHMRAVKFVPPALRVDFLVAEARRRNPADAAGGGEQGRRSGQGDGGPGGAVVNRHSVSTLQKRHRFDAIAVGIADEGGVIAAVIFRAQAGRAVGSAAGIERSGVERIDRRGIGRAQTDMHAAVGERRDPSRRAY